MNVAMSLPVSEWSNSILSKLWEHTRLIKGVMARICEYANLRVGASNILNAGLSLFTSVSRKNGERLAILMNGFLVYFKKRI